MRLSRVGALFVLVGVVVGACGRSNERSSAVRPGKIEREGGCRDAPQSGSGVALAVRGGAARQDYAVWLASCGAQHAEAESRLARGARDAMEIMLDRLSIEALTRYLARRLAHGDFYKVGYWEDEAPALWLAAAEGAEEAAWACLCCVLGSRQDFLQRSLALCENAMAESEASWAVPPSVAIGAYLALRSRPAGAWVCGYPDGSAPLLPRADEGRRSWARLESLIRHGQSVVRWMGLRLARAGSAYDPSLLDALAETYPGGLARGPGAWADVERPEASALADLLSEWAASDGKAKRLLETLAKTTEEVAYQARMAVAAVEFRRPRARIRGGWRPEPPSLPTLAIGIRSGKDVETLLLDLEAPGAPWGSTEVLPTLAPLAGEELRVLRRLMHTLEGGSLGNENFDDVRIAWVLSEPDTAKVAATLASQWSYYVKFFCERGSPRPWATERIAQAVSHAHKLPDPLGVAVLDAVVWRDASPFGKAIAQWRARHDGERLTWPESVGLLVRGQGWLRARSWRDELAFFSGLAEEPELASVLLGALDAKLREQATDGGVDLDAWIEGLPDPAVRAAARITLRE